MNPLFLLWLVLAVNAQDYFPLQVGNQWLYRTTGNRPEGNLKLEVTRQVEADGNSYFELDGFAGGPYLVRLNEEGSLVAYDGATRQERLWWAFQAPEGSTYDTGLPECCGRATLVSRSAKYDGPLGQLPTALEMVYPGVFQVGIAWEQFLPGIGLVHRIENTGGPSFSRHDLVYASLRGNDVFSAPEVSFSMTLDDSKYVSGVPIQARLTLTNRQPEPLTLSFPTSQRYDFVLRDAAGAVRYRWSDGMGFLQVLGEERIEGEKHWVVTLRPTALPPGTYTLEASLTAPAWKAVTGITISPVK